MLCPNAIITGIFILVAFSGSDLVSYIGCLITTKA